MIQLFFIICQLCFNSYDQLFYNNSINLYSMKGKIILLHLVTVTIILLLNNYNEKKIQASNSLRQQPSSKYLKTQNKFYDLYMKAKIFPPFDQWCKIHGKAYINQKERSYRMQIYIQNIKKIKQHNIQYQLGKQTFFKGMNAFGDLTQSQFAELFNWKQDPRSKVTTQCTGSIMDAPNPPTDLDWGNKVGEIIEQGSCGRDWAIVAVSAVQSLYALKMATLPNLSVQQLLQCSVDYGNEGCYGGFMDQAFEYIIDNGIATSKTYPDNITQKQIGKCKYTLNMKFTGFTKCARIPSKSYSKLLSAVVQQPVSIAMDQNPDMQFYHGDLYTGKCTSTLNHGMLLVGYGGDQVDNYFWKLRNSLGTKWGANGYLYLKRVQSDGDGVCGIQIWPSVPQNII